MIAKPRATEELVDEAFEDHLRAVAAAKQELRAGIAQGARVLARAINSGHKVLFCGNGGSAADAQHLAAELLGRFARERRAIPALALTTDSSALTAIGNDYGFEHVFRRQVEAHGRPGDVLVAISTSGESASTLAALDEARRREVFTIGLLGKGGGRMRDRCDLALVVPSLDTARVQEVHILIGHVLCAAVEDALEASA